jgi:hypothetical protein
MLRKINGSHGCEEEKKPNKESNVIENDSFVTTRADRGQRSVRRVYVGKYAGNRGDETDD